MTGVATVVTMKAKCRCQGPTASFGIRGAASKAKRRKSHFDRVRLRTIMSRERTVVQRHTSSIIKFYSCHPHACSFTARGHSHYCFVTYDNHRPPFVETVGNANSHTHSPFRTRRNDCWIDSGLVIHHEVSQSILYEIMMDSGARTIHSFSHSLCKRCFHTMVVSKRSRPSCGERRISAEPCSDDNQYLSHRMDHRNAIWM